MATIFYCYILTTLNGKFTNAVLLGFVGVKSCCDRASREQTPLLWNYTQHRP